MNSKKSKFLYIAYLIVMLGLGVYINAVLKDKNIHIMTVDNSKQDKAKEERKPVKVTLNIVKDNINTTLKYEMTTYDSVEELLRLARKNYHIDYELDRYTNGLIINVSNNTPQNNPWRVLFNNKDITNEITEKHLVDGGVYELTDK